MTRVSGLSTEAVTNPILDRIKSVYFKMNDLDRRVQMFPTEGSSLGPALAILAQEISRVRQFTFQIVKDLEAQKAAAMPPQDAQPS